MEEEVTFAQMNADTLHVGIGTALGFQLIFMATRLYAKFRLRRNFHTDDYIMIVASVVVLTESIMGILSPRWGTGWHSTDLNPAWAPHHGRLLYAFHVVFPTACALPKAALCSAYLRLFPSRSSKLFCFSFLVFLAVYVIIATLVQAVQCIPVSWSWDYYPDTTTNNCLNVRTTLIASAAVNSVADVVAYLFPIRRLWRMQLPMRQRVGLLLIFCTGAVVSIAGIARISYIMDFYKAEDRMAAMHRVWLISIVEINVGIMCGCLQELRVVLSFVVPNLFSAHSDHEPYYAHQARPPQIRIPAHAMFFPFQPLSPITVTKSITVETTRKWEARSNSKKAEEFELGDCSPSGSTLSTLIEHTKSEGKKKRKMSRVSSQVSVSCRASRAESSEQENHFLGQGEMEPRSRRFSTSSEDAILVVPEVDDQLRNAPEPLEPHAL